MADYRSWLVCLLTLKLIEYLPRDDYEALIHHCDVGLISLDARFTVPNFPSKTTDYLKCGLPIFAMLDEVAAKDYGFFLENIAKAGKFVLAKDIESQYHVLGKMLKDKAQLHDFSQQGRDFFVKHLSVKQAAERIIAFSDVTDDAKSPQPMVATIDTLVSAGK